MSSAVPAGRDLDLLRAMLDRVDQQDPGAFNNLGVLYHARGLHREAVDAFLRALALDPRMRPAARNLEVAAARPGACDDRLARLDARIATDPDDRAAQRERAQLLRLIGRTDDAVRLFDALIAEDPDDGDALFERGCIEQRAGDLRRAQRWFERAVNAGARGGARLHLAEVLFQRGKNEQALDVLDRLLAHAPDEAEAHLLRGFVLGEMGRHEAAMIAARRAKALNPALQTLHADLSIDPTAGVAGGLAGATALAGPSGPVMAPSSEAALARYGLGLAFRQRGYFREARAEFARALAHGEDARLVRHALAELDLLDGASSAARERYETLLAEEETARWWNEHGVALHQAGEVDGAADSYRRALRLDPRHALAYNNLGVALADRRDSSVARDALARAGELDPSLLLARLNLGRWHAQRGEALTALDLLRELVAFHPREADAWHTLGVVLAQLRRPEEARDALVQAIEQQPKHADARFALAQVLETLGDPDGATREMQQALGLASVRRDLHLVVGIDLQRECPEAVGSIDLLRLGGGTPLAGVALDADTVGALLPERMLASALAVETEPATWVGERARRACDLADGFGARTLHGEAVERYRAARTLLEAHDDAAALAVWRRAAIGEARALCLLQQAPEARPLLKRLGAVSPTDPEVLVLYAAATADDESVGSDEARRELVRTALLRLLSQPVSSAALLHYAGDIASRFPDPGVALACYRRALACDPARPTPRVAIARLLRTRGDLLAARLELVAALATAPHWREALLELARVHRTASRLPDARVVLVRHLTRVPTDLEALDLLAEVLIAEERQDDARVVVARLLRHDPDRPAALWFDSLLLTEQSRWREAHARWTRLATVPDGGAWAERAQAALTRAAQLAGGRSTPACGTSAIERVA
ncbi:MAG: tetratricopeptide repeat protein [Gemmatimonas sp.]|jgi:tetratricopeptide (TPR) repeat protein|uniref:tetratricopeptide repeat protein n=1 Tax=Gemmatimonas sp. TaxID=1962908 RepID=UPI00391F4FDA|nr:tetratricopeptide repeat protein [Gemmatimonadota bacterium]